jgi:hypothetical protein
MRRVAVVLLAFVAVIGLGAYAVARYVDLHIPFVTDTCRVYAGDHVVRVDPEQLDHAATIASVGIRRDLPERAVTIALATAWQESKLRNLAGGDRDSIGLFQQRPSKGWGTPDKLNDPRYAAGQFYDHLVKVNGWQEMRLTDAAQAVQRSGHPELYQKWEPDAQALATAFHGTAVGAVTCQLREAAKGGGETETRKVLTELSLDLGKLSVTAGRDPKAPSLTVAVGGGANNTLGWRTAHWFVAKSKVFGVHRVAHAGRVWTADSGEWRKDAKATATHVRIGIVPAS